MRQCRVTLVALGIAALSACSAHEYDGGDHGPAADVAAIRTVEWSRWARGVTPSDFRAPVGVAVDGDVAVAAASPGEGGWAVTAYRKRNGRWAAVREHPAAPAHCLFAHDAISADREAALFATVLAVAPVNRVYPDDRVMTMNAATDRIPCQDPN